MDGGEAVGREAVGEDVRETAHGDAADGGVARQNTRSL